jgi:muramidase (phage lysozyme)
MNDREIFLPSSEMTENERRIATEYVLLPLIRTAFERDRKVIAMTNTKFRPLYLEIFDDMIYRVTQDLRRNKQELFSSHISMTKRDWFSYEVYLRGRLFEFVYQKSVAMDWIHERVRDYLRS